jgi:small-conductance mechanosensitive channel
MWEKWLRPEYYRLLLAPLVFFLSLSGFLTLKSVVWKRGRVRAANSEALWDDYFFDSSDRPIYLLIFGISLTFALQFTPDAVRRHPFILNGTKIFILLSLTMLASRLFSLYIRFGKLPFEAPEAVKNLLSGIARVLIYATGILFCLDNLGISITPLIASLGVGSLAVALALQDTLGNIFSGVYLLVDKPIRIGHTVRVNDSNVEGVVKLIGWRSTRILVANNATVIIPNSKLSTSIITNYEIPFSDVSIPIELTVSRQEDLEKVENLSLEIANRVQRSVEGASLDFTPVVRYTAIQDFRVLFSVILQAKHTSQGGLLKHAFIKEIQKRFREEKISF